MGLPSVSIDRDRIASPVRYKGCKRRIETSRLFGARCEGFSVRGRFAKVYRPSPRLAAIKARAADLAPTIAEIQEGADQVLDVAQRVGAAVAVAAAAEADRDACGRCPIVGDVDAAGALEAPRPISVSS